MLFDDFQGLYSFHENKIKTDRQEYFQLVCRSCGVDVNLLTDLMTLIRQTEKLLMRIR